MTATLYSLRLSHPAHAVGLMLERKGIDHEVRNLMAGFHPLLVHAAGFRGGTVPALKIDGRRIQRSREIAAALDEIQPEPALFPADLERRLPDPPLPPAGLVAAGVTIGRMRGDARGL
ncbi:MAG: glutathione S-transferase N-terminal domain-containing protein [Thermoleophilaceae bacterium]